MFDDTFTPFWKYNCVNSIFKLQVLICLFFFRCLCDLHGKKEKYCPLQMWPLCRMWKLLQHIKTLPNLSEKDYWQGASFQLLIITKCTFVITKNFTWLLLKQLFLINSELPVTYWFICLFNVCLILFYYIFFQIFSYT